MNTISLLSVHRTLSLLYLKLVEWRSVLCTHPVQSQAAKNKTIDSQWGNTQFSGNGATTLPPRLLAFSQSSHYNWGLRGGYLSLDQRKKMKFMLQESGYAAPDIRKHESLQWSSLSNPNARSLRHSKAASHEMAFSSYSSWNFKEIFWKII